jgi:hypothetical protein
MRSKSHDESIEISITSNDLASLNIIPSQTLNSSQN